MNTKSLPSLFGKDGFRQACIARDAEPIFQSLVADNESRKQRGLPEFEASCELAKAIAQNAYKRTDPTVTVSGESWEIELSKIELEAFDAYCDKRPDLIQRLGTEAVLRMFLCNFRMIRNP